MREESRTAFKDGILKCLPPPQQLVFRFAEPCLVWTKRDGGWNGEYQNRPNLTRATLDSHRHLDEIAAVFSKVFFEQYPEYNGMVGLSGFGRINLAHPNINILTCAVEDLWARHGSLDCDEAAIEEIVEEFAQFIDQPTVPFLFRSQLLNFIMPVERLDVSDAVIVRRLREEEISGIYGGRMEDMVFRRRPAPIHEFVLEGQFHEGKIFGDQYCLPAVNAAKARLEKAILSLRTFKTGYVGCDSIQFEPLTFCPLPCGSIGFGDLYVPWGRYDLSEDDLGPFREHADLMFRVSEPVIEMTCHRLADAETRTRPEDRLIDAVIGMESILLGSLGGQPGELSYRFSLHYSMLFGSPEDRYKAFREARDLYTLRSRIAHGHGSHAGPFKVGEAKLTLAAAALRTTEALRLVVRYFLPTVPDAPYLKSHFWDRLVFGLPDIERE